MKEEAGLATMLTNMDEAYARTQKLHAFCILTAACQRDAIVSESQDQLARRLHEAYVAGAKKAGESAAQNPSLVDWTHLPEEMKESNRLQADHVALKLRQIGCRLEFTGDVAGKVFEFQADEVERLARMEHARWLAEKKLAGWRFAAGPRDAAQKANPNMVPWAELSSSVRDANRKAITALPRQLEQMGLKIVRLAA